MIVRPEWQVYSDGELARVAATGDRQAFAAIYDRHADRLHDFCVGMLRNRDAAASSAPSENPPTTTAVCQRRTNRAACPPVHLRLSSALLLSSVHASYRGRSYLGPHPKVVASSRAVANTRSRAAARITAKPQPRCARFNEDV